MKKWMLIPAVAGVLAIGSVALADDSVPSVAKQADKMISLQEAKQVAAEKVKGGTVTEIELDKDDDRYHFDVDMKDGKYEYDLEVDAFTGEVIKFEKEAEKNRKQVKSDKLLTTEEAIAIAKKRASGTVKEIELGEDDGRKEYDIEMKDDQFKYEIEIDAVTGEFLKFEKESYRSAKKEAKVQPQKQVNAQTEKVAASTLKVAEPAKQAVKSVDNKKADSKTMLTKDQALTIAKQHASGVVTDFELDDNVYEIEMEDGDIEYELDIDAYTGAILSFERDDD